MKSGRIGVFLMSLVLSGHLSTVNATEQMPEPEPQASPMGKMRAVVESNNFDKDWGIAIGLKAWANEWDLPVVWHPSGLTGERSTSVLQFNSDLEIGYMPSFIARYRNFFIGGSFLPSTDYTFQEHNIHGTTLITPGDVSIGEMVINVKGERQEWDINMGYLLTPNLAVSLGYKTIDREYEYQGTFTNYIGEFANIPIPSNLKESYTTNAPIVGLAGSFPVGMNFNFYGNLAYGLLGGDMDGNYYLAELGVDYSLPLEGFVTAVSLSAGYRFQRLDVESDWGVDMSDTTSGLTLGVRAMF